MNRRPLVTATALLAALLALAACGGTEPTAATPDIPTGLAPRGETRAGLVVERDVDGDTIKVRIDGETESVRLIGINTPETVKPDSPVECFGPESSEFAKETLTGQRITLEYDDSQGRTDQYDRVLAYVWREVDDGSLRLFNLESVAGGYAYERQYGPTAYAWKSEFARAEDDARAAEAGLWGACP